MGVPQLVPDNHSVETVALRLFRLSRDLTQTKLGKAVHIPAAEIGYMEQGRLTPTENQAERLSACFGVPAEILFKRVDLVQVLERL